MCEQSMDTRRLTNDIQAHSDYASFKLPLENSANASENSWKQHIVLFQIHEKRIMCLCLTDVVVTKHAAVHFNSLWWDNMRNSVKEF